MSLFSRNKPATDVPVDDVAFESLRRSPRGPRKRAAAADAEGTVLLDPTEASRTRARRRLIGAIALALAAIVFVPMLFDRAPVAPVDDIALQIPDRNTPFEGRRGVPDPSRGPLKPSSELPTPAAPIVAPAPDPATPAAPDTAAKAEVPKPADRTTDKPVETRPVDRPKPAVAPPPDDPRALAALEGRTDLPASTAAAPATAPTADKTYAVQVAAFSAPDKARGLRDQLVAGGLRSYTESVSTAQGLRTRVRLGPFPSREAADRAKQKLKTMKLDGSVVPL